MQNHPNVPRDIPPLGNGLNDVDLGRNGVGDHRLLQAVAEFQVAYANEVRYRFLRTGVYPRRVSQELITTILTVLRERGFRFFRHHREVTDEAFLRRKISHVLREQYMPTYHSLLAAIAEGEIQREQQLQAQNVQAQVRIQQLEGELRLARAHISLLEGNVDPQPLTEGDGLLDDTVGLDELMSVDFDAILNLDSD